MVIRKEVQRLQVRDNVRGGNGTLENRHIIEPDAMFGSCTLFSEFYFDAGDSIGVHPHDNDAEVYYMLEGQPLLFSTISKGGVCAAERILSSLTAISMLPVGMLGLTEERALTVP